MGLDMYFKAERYVYSYEEDNTLSQDVARNFPECDGLRTTEVVVMVQQWRKANAIHKWFVDNVQNGEDDCGKYSVSMEHIKKLWGTCVAVLEEKTLAVELLPTENGFFFGSTDYDDWYWEDVSATKVMCERILNNASWNNWEFSYQASW